MMTPSWHLIRGGAIRVPFLMEGGKKLLLGVEGKLMLGGRSGRRSEAWEDTAMSELVLTAAGFY